MINDGYDRLAMHILTRTVQDAQGFSLIKKDGEVIKRTKKKSAPAWEYMQTKNFVFWCDFLDMDSKAIVMLVGERR